MVDGYMAHLAIFVFAFAIPACCIICLSAITVSALRAPVRLRRGHGRLGEFRFPLWGAAPGSALRGLEKWALPISASSICMDTQPLALAGRRCCLRGRQGRPPARAARAAPLW